MKFKNKCTYPYIQICIYSYIHTLWLYFCVWSAQSQRTEFWKTVGPHPSVLLLSGSFRLSWNASSGERETCITSSRTPTGEMPPSLPIREKAPSAKLAVRGLEWVLFCLTDQKS